MYWMILHSKLADIELYRLIKVGDINFAGNIKLKIFCKLKCASGKRLKKANRVFFSSEKEAMQAGYRPCGHCMKKDYRAWKAVNSYINSQ